jgi:multiple sugar transport system ATP-binding protein
VTHDQVEAMTMGDRIAVLHDGYLQQADSPRTLYNSPANVFVAGFIGSPSMNFFESTLVGEEGKLWVDTGDFRLRVPDDRKQMYKDYVGREVIFGIRPEHIHHKDYIPPSTISSPFTGQVDVVELLGHELHTYIRSGSNTFVATVDTRAVLNMGDTVPLVADMSNMHLFDKDSELAIR